MSNKAANNMNNYEFESEVEETCSVTNAAGTRGVTTVRVKNTFEQDVKDDKLSCDVGVSKIAHVLALFSTTDESFGSIMQYQFENAEKKQHAVFAVNVFRDKKSTGNFSRTYRASKQEQEEEGKDSDSEVTRPPLKRVRLREPGNRGSVLMSYCNVAAALKTTLGDYGEEKTIAVVPFDGNSNFLGGGGMGEWLSQVESWSTKGSRFLVPINLDFLKSSHTSLERGDPSVLKLEQKVKQDVAKWGNRADLLMSMDVDKYKTDWCTATKYDLLAVLENDLAPNWVWLLAYMVIRSEFRIRFRLFSANTGREFSKSVAVWLFGKEKTRRSPVPNIVQIRMMDDSGSAAKIVCTQVYGKDNLQHHKFNDTTVYMQINHEGPSTSASFFWAINNVSRRAVWVSVQIDEQKPVQIRLENPTTVPCFTDEEAVVFVSPSVGFSDRETLRTKVFGGLPPEVTMYFRPLFQIYDHYQTSLAVMKKIKHLWAEFEKTDTKTGEDRLEIHRRVKDLRLTVAEADGHWKFSYFLSAHDEFRRQSIDLGMDRLRETLLGREDAKLQDSDTLETYRQLEETKNTVENFTDSVYTMFINNMTILSGRHEHSHSLPSMTLRQCSHAEPMFGGSFN